MARLPNAIGIGAPKAGTTWLFQCLVEHPQVFMAACKETNFFSYASIEGRFDEYAQHFRGGINADAVGEISTRYLSAPLAPARIRACLPEARLFASLRNPVDQVYSHYWHLRRQNFHQWTVVDPPRTVEEAVERYPHHLLEPTAYATHLERWLQHFDRSQLLVLLYDDIRTEPRRALRSVYAHLGVDPNFTPRSLSNVNSDVRRGVSPRGHVFERTHAHAYRFMSVHLYYRLKLLVGTRRAARVKDTFRARQIIETMFFRKGYPPMSPATRRFLSARFTNEVQHLEDLLKRDLAAWH